MLSGRQASDPSEAFGHSCLVEAGGLKASLAFPTTLARQVGVVASVEDFVRVTAYRHFLSDGQHHVLTKSIPSDLTSKAIWVSVLERGSLKASILNIVLIDLFTVGGSTRSLLTMKASLDSIQSKEGLPLTDMLPMHSCSKILLNLRQVP